MTKKSPAQTLTTTANLENQAMLIANEIFNLMDQYTNDSNLSKFFLTEEVARASYGLAGGFASVLYAPSLEPENTSDTPILSLLYALITYGFNIYLKEHSLLTNSAPYEIPSDPLMIKIIQKRTLQMTTKGKLLSTPLADKIIDIISGNVKNNMQMREFLVKGHKLNKVKFNAYVKLSLYWGYNFAHKLITAKTKK